MDKQSDKKLGRIGIASQTEKLADPLREMLVDKLLHMLAEVRAGRMVGLFGVAVLEDDNEHGIEIIEEGYTLVEADVILGLEYTARDLRESWEAERIHGIDPTAD